MSLLTIDAPKCVILSVPKLPPVLVHPDAIMPLKRAIAASSLASLRKIHTFYVADGACPACCDTVMKSVHTHAFAALTHAYRVTVSDEYFDDEATTETRIALMWEHVDRVVGPLVDGMLRQAHTLQMMRIFLKLLRQGDPVHDADTLVKHMYAALRHSLECEQVVVCPNGFESAIALRDDIIARYAAVRQDVRRCLDEIIHSAAVNRDPIPDPPSRFSSVRIQEGYDGMVIAAGTMQLTFDLYISTFDPLWPWRRLFDPSRNTDSPLDPAPSARDPETPRARQPPARRAPAQTLSQPFKLGGKKPRDSL